MIIGELGLKKGWVYEVIVVTSGARGEKNFAPMGIWTSDIETVLMDVYKGTKTSENILSNRAFSVNFVSGLEAFYDSLVGDVPEMDADAFLELETIDITESEKKHRITARVAGGEIIRKPHLINRAKPLALESMIKFTRVNEGNMAKILEELRENLRVIKKVAPDSPYEEIVKKILDNKRV